jgi:hypothetical protein
MARAEIIFDIGDSIVERPLMAHMLIACRNAVGRAVTTITECPFFLRLKKTRSPPTRFLRAWNTADLDEKGAIVLREKVSRGRIAARLVNVPQSFNSLWFLLNQARLGSHGRHNGVSGVAVVVETI